MFHPAVAKSPSNESDLGRHPALVASAVKRRKTSSVTRHSPARHLRYTSRAKREADVSLSHRCTMEHPVAPWSTTNATGVTTPRQTVKASPHRHKRVLSHGAPADPSDPWNIHAAPVSPRQNGQRVVKCRGELTEGIDGVTSVGARLQVPFPFRHQGHVLIVYMSNGASCQNHFSP